MINKQIKYIVVYILFTFTIWVNSFAQTPYVILVSCDGFRYDYTQRGITSNLSKLQAYGVTAVSMEPVFPSTTFPNHISILTGLYPENHGIISNSFSDPYTGDIYSYKSNESITNPKWYQGEFFWETARRNGIKSACYFWPGSEINSASRAPDYRESYNSGIDNATRVKGIISWLSLPYEKRPHFLTLYFDDVDSRGHMYGTNSPELNEAIRNVDYNIGLLLDGLKSINMQDSVNIIIMSDHGMVDMNRSQMINLKQYLGDYICRINNFGTYALIEPDTDNLFEIFTLLDDYKENYSVYLKDNIPAYLHFKNHSFIPKILVIAEPGSILTEKTDPSDMKLIGVHGYDPANLNMHGIFIANGPAFRNNFQTGTLRIIDIYPLLCRIFEIPCRTGIDGKLERIDFILK